MARLRYQQAMVKALRDAMLRDPSVFVIGEDVRQSLRGVSKGLFQDLGPDRVLDTPLSEQAFTGFATGAALAGRRPVVEFQIPSLLFLAFEQIANQAQKFSLMTGGQANVPVTYLIPGSGARLGLAGQHSDHPYQFLVHAGVKTVLPATAYDAYGLFLSAIEDDDPVAFFAPAAVLSRRDEVPEESYTIELGKGRVHREGDDVTVVAVGHLVHDALAVAQEMAEEVSIEVFDPRTLHPFDWALLAESVAKTGRLVAFDDSNRSGGLAGEVLATAAEEMELRAPPKRVTRADAVVPFAVGLERAVLPSKELLTNAIRDVMRERGPHMTDVRVPKMGMSTVEVDVVRVLVEPGQRVEAGETVVEIEAEKSELELEAAMAGTIAEVLVSEGDVREVGDVVVRIEQD